jgi:DNA repair ATPase RecN
MTIAALEAEIAKRLEAVTGQLAIKRRTQTELDEEDAAIVQLQNAYSIEEEARLVIAAVEATQQTQLKQKLEKFVSRALTVIFDRPYQFIVDYETRGQQSDVTFKVMDEGGNAQPLKDAHGGGLFVVTAFVLRVIILLSARPQLRRFIVQDEPFIQVSNEYRENLVQFIQAFAKSADMQFIFVTHEPELAAIGDKRYRFRLANGVTQIEPLP